MDFFNIWGATIIVMIILGTFGYKYYYRKFLNEIKEDPFSENEGPQAVASLGVLGTFIGITYGLWSFNANGLEQSVPALLDGMKTAFITSIAGMTASLYMKWKQKQLQNKNGNIHLEVSDDATIKDLIIYLKEKEQSSLLAKDKFNEQLLKSIENVNKSISGESDTTLLSQIKNLRLAVIDNQNNISSEIRLMHEEMVKAFNDFASQMAENSSKAFIKALNESIKDFNTKLQEQFGENFKQLNIAVGKLLTWQEEYKNTIIDVTENQKLIFAGIEQAKSSLNDMATNSVKINELATKLSEIILTAERYQKELEVSLNTLVDISNKAKQLIPNIAELTNLTNDNILQISKNAQKEITDNSTRISALTVDNLNLVKMNLDNITETISNKSKNILDLLDEHNKVLNTSFTKANENMLSFNKTFNDTLNNTSNNFSSVLSNMIETHNNNINVATNSMINNIDNNLNFVIQSLDKQIKESITKIQRLVNEVIRLINIQQTTLDNSFKENSNKIEMSTDKAIKSIDATASKLQSTAVGITEKLSDRLFNSNEDLKKYNENVYKVFNENLLNFSQQLVKLSNQFVKDYAPLTERLQKIVEISKDIKLNN